ncbi:GNAT family N-acetyltransferase [Brevibacillus migulae]|uniref:GNAT family N-acetyltransferase n=1 Tax=Brevibacillus migulae TaxID=1644114 RepID=UPI00106DFA5D|nr:GNAT family N-acetyltransferase [Brevibacillus migulae]
MQTSLQGLHKRNVLTPGELEQIQRLEQTCTAHDGFALKLNWSMLRSRQGDAPQDYLYYKDGELIAFLGLYSFGSEEVEVSGMVHPAYRRQGIFRGMLEEAIADSRSRKFGRLLLIVTGQSSTGKAFAEAFGADYTFSEYYMERVHPPSQQLDLPIQLRSAAFTDLELLAQWNADGFSMPIEDAREYARKTLENQETTYVAESDGQPVGKISVRLDEKQAFYYGFVVAKELRGRGYGRAILLKTMEHTEQELHKSHHSLEVAAKNESALHLYRSCGFESVRSIEYYLISLEG